MGRSIPISITSTTLSSFAVHLANMTKVLAFILLGLVAIVLSENAEDQSGEIDNIRSDNYLELNREIREADPGKKNKKGRKGGKNKRKGGKKARKGGKKNRKGGKKARKASKKAGGKKKMKGGKKSSKSKLGKKKRKGSKKARKGQMNSGK